MTEGAPKYAVTTDGLAKTYRIHERGSTGLWGLLSGRVSWIEHVALSNLTLQIPCGQALGIVGRNGAGKSTLLKILAGTLTPTAGNAVVNGSISALLELGSGFHPDFTGRQNVYLGGLCMGMSRKEIDERFDEILAFADLPDVIDRPFRTYSTGMQTRLSFSVAVALEPDVMIVDEALSVGDAKFQAKCFRRFEYLKARGTTILLVSHSMPSIISFCDRAILLENGRLLEDGDPRDIDKAYQRLLFGGEIAADVDAAAPKEGEGLPAAEIVSSADNKPIQKGAASHAIDYESVLGRARLPLSKGLASNQFGSGEARIVSGAVVDEFGELTDVLQTGRRFSIVLEVEGVVDVEDLVVGFWIRTPRGDDVFGVDFQTDCDETIRLKAGARAIVRLDGVAWLASNDYVVTLGLAHADKRKIDLRYDELHFRIRGTERLYTASVANIEHKIFVDGRPLWDVAESSIAHTQAAQ